MKLLNKSDYEQGCATQVTAYNRIAQRRTTLQGKIVRWTRSIIEYGKVITSIETIIKGLRNRIQKTQDQDMELKKLQRTAHNDLMKQHQAMLAKARLKERTRIRKKYNL